MWFFTRFGSFWNRGQTSKFSFNNFTPGLLASAVEFPPGFRKLSDGELGTPRRISVKKPGFLAGGSKNLVEKTGGMQKKKQTPGSSKWPFFLMVLSEPFSRETSDRHLEGHLEEASK